MYKFDPELLKEAVAKMQKQCFDDMNRIVWDKTKEDNSNVFNSEKHYSESAINHNTTSASISMQEIQENMWSLETWVYRSENLEKDKLYILNPKELGRKYPDKIIYAHPDDYDILKRKVEYKQEQFNLDALSNTVAPRLFEHELRGSSYYGFVFKSEPSVDYDKLREEAEEEYRYHRESMEKENEEEENNV
jgi:hypothetical protein